MGQSIRFHHQIQKFPHRGHDGGDDDVHGRGHVRDDGGDDDRRILILHQNRFLYPIIQVCLFLYEVHEQQIPVQLQFFLNFCSILGFQQHHR